MLVSSFLPDTPISMIQTLRFSLTILLPLTHAIPFPAQAPSLSKANTTLPAPIGYPDVDVQCSTESDLPISSTSCLGIAILIRTLPNFHINQEFREHVRPQIYPDTPDSKPPFAFTAINERCTFILKASPPVGADRFSWEDVDVAAIEVLRQCPIHGGVASVGDFASWELIVLRESPQRILLPQQDGFEGFSVNAITTSNGSVIASNRSSTSQTPASPDSPPSTPADPDMSLSSAGHTASPS